MNADRLDTASETTPAEASRKAYHSPEFRDYGTVADLTHTSQPTSPVNYDNGAFTGYINSIPST